MILLAIFTVTLLLGGTLVAGIGFCFSETSRELRLAFALLVAVGCVAAVWCTFGIEYQLSPTLRIAGFPLPVAIFQLQDGRWIDFVGGPGLFIDLIVVPSFIAMPLSLMLCVRWLRRRRSERLRGFPVALSHPQADEGGYTAGVVSNPTQSVAEPSDRF